MSSVLDFLELPFAIMGLAMTIRMVCSCRAIWQCPQPWLKVSLIMAALGGALTALGLFAPKDSWRALVGYVGVLVMWAGLVVGWYAIPRGIREEIDAAIKRGE